MASGVGFVLAPDCFAHYSTQVKIQLSKETLASLPVPDAQGMVRVTAAMTVSESGEATIVKINDTPVGTNDDEAPMPAKDLPDLGAAEAAIGQY